MGGVERPEALPQKPLHFCRASPLSRVEDVGNTLEPTGPLLRRRLWSGEALRRACRTAFSRVRKRAKRAGALRNSVRADWLLYPSRFPDLIRGSTPPAFNDGQRLLRIGSGFSNLWIPCRRDALPNYREFCWGQA